MIFFLCSFWSGLIIGVSFIATPAKFLTTSLSLSQLLEVGSVTFGTFMCVEYLFITLLLITITKIDKTLLLYKRLLPIMILIMLMQYVFVLPMLDERVEKIAQGLTLEPSNLHLLYVLAEFSKLTILIILGSIAQQRTRQLSTHAVT